MTARITWKALVEEAQAIEKDTGLPLRARGQNGVYALGLMLDGGGYRLVSDWLTARELWQFMAGYRDIAALTARKVSA